MKLTLLKAQREVFERIQDLGLALRAADLCEDGTEEFVGKPLMPLLKGFMEGTQGVSLTSLATFLDWDVPEWLSESSLLKKDVVATDLTKDQRDQVLGMLYDYLSEVVAQVDEYDPKNKGVTLK